MEINAYVRSIDKLKEYFFIVPDYQREYVWKADDQVEQFLEDIDNEYDEGVNHQQSYFIGSIILVENSGKYDVIDGQQRLTTIVLTLCALRELLKLQTLDEKQQAYLKNIEEWLSNFDIDTDETQTRLELQYEESKDYLEKLISRHPYEGEVTASIKKMQSAYERIEAHLQGYLSIGVTELAAFARYFLTKIELVVIESENLSNALKIFETINQRGAGLNAMDLVKNLLFSQAKESDFQVIKEKWKIITANLQDCGEEQSPLRFLRYFLMARYHDGILREDEIYKWIISAEGKSITKYESQPLELAKELEKMSKRYSDLVNATMLQKDGGAYPAVTRIGFMNKYKSRQHLILLLALPVNCSKDNLEYLASQLESFFFMTITLGIQAKNNERSFAQWATKLRSVGSTADLSAVIDNTIRPYMQERYGQFRQAFLSRGYGHFKPLYRVRFVLGSIENTILRHCGLPTKGLEYFDCLQVEHVLPQTPKNNKLPEEFSDRDDYDQTIGMIGNAALLESTINQAVNKCNDLENDWYIQKQKEYEKSSVVSTALMNTNYAIGKDTGLNRFRKQYNYLFGNWDKKSIAARQQILFQLACETWLINGEKLDQLGKSSADQE